MQLREAIPLAEMLLHQSDFIVNQAEIIFRALRVVGDTGITSAIIAASLAEGNMNIERKRAVA
jgi:hypothetical protein